MTKIQKKTSPADSSNISLKANPEIKNPHSIIQEFQMASVYKGPLPCPEAFERYNRTLPGAADRILAMAEDEAKHRRSIEETTIKQNIKLAHIGQTCAFVLAFFGLLASTYCAIIGKEWAASFIATGGLAALISPFLKNWFSERK